MVGCNPLRVREVVDISNYGGIDLKTGDRYVDQEIVGSRWTGVHHQPHDEPLEDCALINCQLRWAEKWLSRGYRVRQILVDQCELIGVLHEHGIYWNVSGGLPAKVTHPELAIYIRQTLFRDISSQAVQMTSPWDPNPGRSEPHESIDPVEDRKPGLGVKLEDIYAENIGCQTGHARAGFAFTFFQMPNDVWLNRVTLENRMQLRSEGGFVCLERHTPTSRFRMDHCAFHMGDLQKPLGLIEDVKNVVIQDCDFTARGGQAWIDINRVEHLSFRRCHGNIQIKRDGVFLGSVQDLDLDSEAG